MSDSVKLKCFPEVLFGLAVLYGKLFFSRPDPATNNLKQKYLKLPKSTEIVNEKVTFV